MYTVSETYQAAMRGLSRCICAKLTAGESEYRDERELVSLSVVSGAGGTEKLIGNAVSAAITAELAGAVELPAEGTEMRAHFWPDGLTEEDAVPSVPFRVERVERDEDAGTVVLTGHDAMQLLEVHSADEITVTFPTTVGEYAAAAAATAGLLLANTDWFSADVVLESAPNLNGNETCRQVIAWVAECAFGNAQIDRNGAIQITSVVCPGDGEEIHPDLYFECELGNAYGPINTLVLARLPQGDNIFREDADAVAADGRIALTVADNPFWDTMRENVIEGLFAFIRGCVVQPYRLDWCGDPAMDPGDSIVLTDTKGRRVKSFFGAQVLEFDGGMRSEVELCAPSNETGNISKATGVREVARRTRLQVDKTNQRIDFEASRLDGVEGNVAAMTVTTEQIRQSVSAARQENDVLKTRVASIEADADGVRLQVQKIVENGVGRVATATGAVLDENGLHVTRSGEEMESRIDYAGLHVERGVTAVLVADHRGVEAENVLVRTWLTVGENSRFEDYDGGRRTGCFWTGG